MHAAHIVGSSSSSVDGRSLEREGSSVVDEISIVAYDSLNGLKESWKTLEAMQNASVYQSYEWVKTCLSSLEANGTHQPLIVVGYLDDEPAFILPFTIKGRRFKTLRWIGGSHSNYNMPLFSDQFLKSCTTTDIQAIFRRVLRILPNLSMVRLCCQPEAWNGHVNPLFNISHLRSMNPAFEMDLEGGLQGVLSRTNGKRKRKKFRGQERICEEHGGYKLIIPETSGEALKLMDTFRQQKADRFRKMGISNVFKSEPAEKFLHQLAVLSVASDEPVMRLYGLEIGGKIRAVYGGGISNGRFSGYFSSIAEDELAYMSPGEMLLYLLVDDCGKRGFKHIDLGAGDERYKRSWCNDRIDLFDTIIPVRPLAYPVAFCISQIEYLKRKMRSNAKAWNWFKRLRRVKGALLTGFGRH